MVDQMQLSGLCDAEDLTRELTVKRSHLRDDAVFGQAFEERGSVRHHDAPSQVLLAELGRMLEQPLVPG